jgi:hypothetical protein
VEASFSGDLGKTLSKAFDVDGGRERLDRKT